MVKNTPAMQETTQETQAQSLGGKDSLEKGKATYSSSLAWRIPWTEEHLGYVHGVTKARTQLSIHTQYSKSCMLLHLNIIISIL